MDPRVERTRQTVLTSARELMLADGLDAVTYARLAEHAGVGRRTLYRHWPSRTVLLHEVLGGASFPTWEPTGDLRADARRHLEQLRVALVDGPLAVIVVALAERSTTDPAVASLRTSLVESGCAPLRRLLEDAQRRGELPAGDVATRIAELEGPLFYVVCIQGGIPTDALLDDLVDRVLQTVVPDRPSQ